MTSPDLAYGNCDTCGASREWMDLDAKPKRFRGYTGANQLALLCEAADRGEEFDLLECAGCYGPGFCQNREESCMSDDIEAKARKLAALAYCNPLSLVVAEIAAALRAERERTIRQCAGKAFAAACKLHEPAIGNECEFAILALLNPEKEQQP